MAEDRTDIIKRAAEMLLKEGAREVYVFGSRASGDHGEDPDLDLAVAGLPPERYFQVIGDLMTELRVDVDLIDLDHDTPFSRFLRERGALRRVA